VAAAQVAAAQVAVAQVAVVARVGATAATTSEPGRTRQAPISFPAPSLG
jgi:hypothetical protein